MISGQLRPRLVALWSGALFLPLVPLRMTRVVLGASRRAEAHPTSLEMQSLLAAGFRVIGWWWERDPTTLHLLLSRGEEVRELGSSDLAFALYSTRLIPRSVLRVVPPDPGETP